MAEGFRGCRGQYGLYLHRGDTLAEQAYQLIDYRAFFPAGTPGEPSRLRVGAFFRFLSAPAATKTFKLTVFTFSGYEPESFPSEGDPYDYADRATSIQTTRGTVTTGTDWVPIQTVHTLPPEVDVLLVVLEYELAGDALESDLYVDGVEVVLDAGPYGPIANPDRPVTRRGEPVDIDVLGNDQDPDSPIDPATLRVVVAPSHGTAVVKADGVITYTPEAGYTGADPFTWEAFVHRRFILNLQGTQSSHATYLLTIW